LDNIRLAVPAEELTYHKSFVLRGLSALPLTFSARA
jgi:hypothetical protein